ncbi:DUF1697 domain-containing protein [Dokdonia sinensis]|uniref:DUF1697 domain-containing protein n=1 Tax=Dokdonia sinensis TaxID=2479847 RepID=A0A3M0G326_9FLAO|nr:DUF1697 domain-containing protein [Dokdonia sinensis]RMB58557.1 DUF1697 domain-containing protein [Dokdonia sinensis]
MNKYIALLRGINVGGHRKILMADLKVLFQELGFKNVETHIQSGNVVFESCGGDVSAFAKAIKEKIKQSYNFEVLTLVLDLQTLQKIILDCPFPKEQKEKSYFILLDNPPTKEKTATLNAEVYADEEFHITSRCVYFFASNGYGRAKLTGNIIERKLNVNATARNYRTMSKLLEMAS